MAENLSDEALAVYLFYPDDLSVRNRRAPAMKKTRTLEGRKGAAPNFPGVRHSPVSFGLKHGRIYSRDFKLWHGKQKRPGADCARPFSHSRE
jgi:hypothetical protein